MLNYIRHAKNGYSGLVIFHDKPVYYRYHCGERQSTLGSKMNKSNWIKEHVNSSEAEMHVKNSLRTGACMRKDGSLYMMKMILTILHICLIIYVN